jgi:UDP:flavonoid glycosyltransferase YjiC (YdhE family)
VGRSIPVGRLTVDRLRDAVRTVLGDPAYRERARRLRSNIEAADGLNQAADLIEGAFGTGQRAVPSKDGGTGSLQPTGGGSWDRSLSV